MTALIGILLAVTAVLVWMVSARWARRTGRGAGRDPAAARPPRRRGVGQMLRVEADCCDAARQLAAAWHPEHASLPRLPLPACDRAERCRCAWEKVYDRRIGPRRQQGDRRQTLRIDAPPDRRAGKDRRKSDIDPWKR